MPPTAEEIQAENERVKALLSFHEPEQAKEIIDELLSISRDTLGDDNPVTMRVMSTFADVLEGLGYRDGARQGHEVVLALRREHLGEDDPETQDSIRRIAMLTDSS